MQQNKDFSTSPPANNNENEQKKIIVIVEDDEDLLVMITFALESEGLKVHGITNGADAINFLLKNENSRTISLLILDRILPDMDGIDILKKIAAKYPKHMPVLILSALSAEQDILSGLKYGAVDYMTKPFSLEILIEKVRILINK